MKKAKILLASALVVTSVFSVGIQKAYAYTAKTTLNAAEEEAANAVSGSISLHGNCTTGYEWTYKVKDTFIAEVTEKELISDDLTGTLCGAGQTQVWEVKGLIPGTTEVTFNYLRPWEAEVLQSKTYVINVDSDLNVTVSKKAAEPVNASIALQSDDYNGYLWKYGIEDESIAKLTEGPTAYDDSLEHMDGSLETHTWEVKGLKEGTTEVTFNYLERWMNKIDKTVTYVIKVDSDLNVTVREKTVPADGNIYLEGNASTGYVWQYAVKDESIAKLTSDIYESSVPAEEQPAPGCSQTDIWTVKGLKEGTTEVTFNYLRPGENEIDTTITYVIKVDSDLNVTVTKKAAEDPVKPVIKNLKVEESDSEFSNQINPTISFENAGEESLDLTKMKFRYYYTADGEQDENFVCYYAGTTNGEYKALTSNVEGKIVKLKGEEAKENADRCLEITFNGGVLDAGQGMTMQLCVHKDNWTSYYRLNDYSYQSSDKVLLIVDK